MKKQIIKFKDGKEKIVWLIVGALIMLLATNIWDSYTKAKIEVKCYQEEYESFKYIVLYIENPSKYSVEDYNLIIDFIYKGYQSSGLGVCEAKAKHTESRFTVVKCGFISPKSIIKITFNLEDDSVNEFSYSSWGENIKIVEGEYIYCPCIKMG